MAALLGSASWSRMFVNYNNKIVAAGSCCGTVGSAVASKPVDPGSNPVTGNFIEQLSTVCGKDKNE